MKKEGSTENKWLNAMLLVFILCLIPLGIYRLKHNVITIGEMPISKLPTINSGWGFLATGIVLLALLIYRIKNRKRIIRETVENDQSIENS